MCPNRPKCLTSSSSSHDIDNGPSVTWVCYRRIRMNRFAFLQISREIASISFQKFSNNRRNITKKLNISHFCLKDKSILNHLGQNFHTQLAKRKSTAKLDFPEYCFKRITWKTPGLCQKKNPNISKYRINFLVFSKYLGNFQIPPRPPPPPLFADI